MTDDELELKTLQPRVKDLKWFKIHVANIIDKLIKDMSSEP